MSAYANATEEPDRTRIKVVCSSMVHRSARQLILAHLEDLRGDLERRGIRIRRFEVDVDDARLPEEEVRKGDGSPGSVRRQVLDLRA